MGLLYVFPVSHEETDFIIKNERSLTLKSYGLPYIFWIYAFCCLMVIIFMFIAIREPVLKLATLGDETDKLLGYSLLSFIALLPLGILTFFFYEKRIIKLPDALQLEHRVFGIRIFKENFQCKVGSLVIDTFIDSPNVARIKNTQGTTGFQNKGYFVLSLLLDEGSKIQIDRHSRKADLEKLKDLLESIN